MNLDAELRQLKANQAHRLRREAGDLERQARIRRADAKAIEHTWQLRPQCGVEPDLRKADVGLPS